MCMHVHMKPNTFAYDINVNYLNLYAALFTIMVKIAKL